MVYWHRKGKAEGFLIGLQFVVVYEEWCGLVISTGIESSWQIEWLFPPPLKILLTSLFVLSTNSACGAHCWEASASECSLYALSMLSPRKRPVKDLSAVWPRRTSLTCSCSIYVSCMFSHCKTRKT